MDKASGKLVQKTLSEALSLPKDAFCVFKDYVTGLEYIRSCRELTDKGLYVELGSYQCHVFLDWRFVHGEQWQKVCESLNGAGVASVYGKFDELFAVKKEEVIKKRAARKPATKKAAGTKKRVATKPAAVPKTAPARKKPTAKKKGE
jgi:hypothetical protein